MGRSPLYGAPSPPDAERVNTRVIPVGTLTAEQVRSVLLAAAAAPSLLNSQPWLFRCTPDGIELHADLDRAVPAADPDRREMLLACGAALLNARLAIRALGSYPDVRTFPSRTQPDLLAVVRPAGRRPATPADLDLAAAIAHRRTNRRPFLPTAVSTPVRTRLRKAAEVERAWLATVSPAQLPMLRAMLHRAHRIQTEDSEFMAEWSNWTGREDETPDGVPARNSGPLPEPQDQWVLRDFSGGRAALRVPGKDFEPDPLVVVVGSFQDGPPTRLQAGQAMQRVLLTATAAGLSASFLSQVVEVPATRKELRQLIGGGLWPQTVLRIGRGTTPVPPTPRRDLADMLLPPENVEGQFVAGTLVPAAGPNGG